MCLLLLDKLLVVCERTVKYESGQRTFVFPPLKLRDNDFVAIHLHHCGHRPYKEKESGGGPGTDSQQTADDQSASDNRSKSGTLSSSGAL